MAHPQASASTRSRPWLRLIANQPLLIGLGFLVLIAVAIETVWLVRSTETANEMVVHTLDVENEVSTLLLEVRRAEAAQRGFLLTGEPSYEASYREAAAEIPARFERLGALTAENPVQIKNLVALDPPLRGRLEQLENVLQTFKAGQGSEAARLIRTGAERHYSEEIRSAAGAMLAEERRLFEARRREANRVGQQLLLATAGGSLLIVALAALSVLGIRRSHRERDRAHEALEEVNANLEATVAERTADLQEANQEIQRFAYIVSHDLRSPLVNIMGFTSEIEALRDDLFAQIRELRERLSAADAGAISKDEELGRDFDEALGFIKSSIAKMERLIGAILRLSREGRREFKPERLDMRQLLETIRATLAHQASAADATVSIGAVPPITGDRLALEQVFSNLLDNAVKYLKPGQPGHITVEGRVTPTQVIYEISDNGRGIDPKDHARIFDLFRRAGEQDRPGEGIGLAHVRALVRRLGGSLTVQSELGKGSVFTVALPRRWAATAVKEAA